MTAQRLTLAEDKLGRMNGGKWKCDGRGQTSWNLEGNVFSVSVTPADLHGLETMVVTEKTKRENTSLQKRHCEENCRGKASRCVKAGGAERGVWYGQQFPDEAGDTRRRMGR